MNQATKDKCEVLKRFSSAGFAEQLRQIRGTKSQRTFAEALGISQPRLHRLESAKGVPSAIELVAIANYAGYSLDQLVMGAVPAGNGLLRDETCNAKAFTECCRESVPTSSVSGQVAQVYEISRRTMIQDSEFSALLRKAIEGVGGIEELIRRCSRYLTVAGVNELLEQKRLPTGKEVINLSNVIINPATGKGDAQWLARVAGIRLNQLNRSENQTNGAHN